MPTGNSRLTSRRRNDQGFKWARITISILATIGVIDTGSITLNRWGWIGTISCPGNIDGCNKVLESAWGTILELNNFAIPLSLVGFISYLIILSLSIAPLFPGLIDNRYNIYRKTWWSLFYLSTMMAVFSLLLITIMVYKIKEFCFFCVLSALISFSILILSIIGGNWNEYGKLIFRGFLTSIIVLLSGLIWSSSVDPSQELNITNSIGMPPLVQNKSNIEQIKLAEYLTAKGAVMYSAYWCPHCHDQKEMFGKEATTKLNLVECASDGFKNQRELCEKKGITAYPSWEINGLIKSGVQTLKELAEETNYNVDNKY